MQLRTKCAGFLFDSFLSWLVEGKLDRKSFLRIKLSSSMSYSSVHAKFNLEMQIEVSGL